MWNSTVSDIMFCGFSCSSSTFAFHCKGCLFQVLVISVFWEVCEGGGRGFQVLGKGRGCIAASSNRVACMYRIWRKAGQILRSLKGRQGGFVGSSLLSYKLQILGSLHVYRTSPLLIKPQQASSPVLQQEN